MSAALLPALRQRADDRRILDRLQQTKMPEGETGDRREVAHPLIVGDAVVEIGARHRPPLRLVTVEQAGASPPTDHRRQLPGEIVCVLDAGVEAEPAGRRESYAPHRRREKRGRAGMCCGEICREHPGPHQPDREVVRRKAERRRDQRPAARRRELFRRLLRREVGGKQHPLLRQPVGDEDAEHVGIEDPVEDALAVADERGEIGGEIDADHRLQHAAIHRDAEAAPHRAPMRPRRRPHSCRRSSRPVRPSSA